MPVVCFTSSSIVSVRHRQLRFTIRRKLPGYIDWNDIGWCCLFKERRTPTAVNCAYSDVRSGTDLTACLTDLTASIRSNGTQHLVTILIHRCYDTSAQSPRTWLIAAMWGVGYCMPGTRQCTSWKVHRCHGSVWPPQHYARSYWSAGFHPVATGKLRSAAGIPESGLVRESRPVVDWVHGPTGWSYLQWRIVRQSSQRHSLSLFLSLLSFRACL